MAKRPLAALFLAISIAITLPGFAYAAINPTGDQQVYGTGLVSCGVSNDPNIATQCEACNLVQLIQNIIMFLIGLSIPIAVALFAWAGVLYFTSGASSSNENITKAKKIFSSALLGFGLAIGAWLIVNTILYTILSHDPQTGYPNSSWFRVDCSTVTRQTSTIGEVINNTLGIPSTPTQQTTVTPTYSCKSPYVLVEISGIHVCRDEAGHTVGGATVGQTFTSNSGGVLCADGNLACSPSLLAEQPGVSPARANAMSCIAITESSGIPSQINKSGGACGTFQILPSNWSNPLFHSGGCSSSVSCQNAECNMQAALALGNNRKAGGQSYYADWTCPGCNTKAAACVAKYDPGQ